MTPVRLNRQGRAGLLGLVAVIMTLSACSSSDSSDGIETANTTTTVDAKTTDSTTIDGVSESAKTGDASAGTEGGVVQADEAETADAAEDGQATGAGTPTGAGTNGGAADVGGTAEPDSDPGPQPGTPQPTAGEEQAPIDEDSEDDPAAEDRFELDTPGGLLVDLTSGLETDLAAELTETYTLLWFWTPTNPSSGQEAPLVERFAETFAGAIDVVAIGSGGERSAADQFHQSSGLSVTTLWASSDESAAHYGVERVPSTLLIDSAGTIVARWEGLPEEAFRLAERIA